MRLLTVLLTLSLFQLAVFPAWGGDGTEIVLVYSGDTQGHVDPCG